MVAHVIKLVLLAQSARSDNITFNLNLMCKDGGLRDNCNVLANNSKQLEMLLKPLYSECSGCQQYLLLPDFSVLTAARVLELLTNKETIIEEEGEKKAIIQLLATLGCPVITTVIRTKVPVEAGVCGTCHR